MKKIFSMFAVLMVVALASNASAAVLTWTNNGVGNDFANNANWNGPFTAADDYYIFKSGANKAVISSTVPLPPSGNDLYLAAQGGVGTGELLVTGGNNTVSNRLRVGRAGNTGILTITGGTLSVPNTYTTFGDTGTANVTMTGGTFNADRVTLGQTGAFTSTMDLTGGTINISNTDASPSSISGSLRLGDSTTAVNISGTAVVNAEVLIMGINEAPPNGLGGLGVITINAGGTLNLTGSSLASPLPIITFESIPLSGSDWLGGSIAMEGGLWTLAGDQVSFINQSITDGYVTHTSVGGSYLAPVYSAGTGLTTVTIVPEPSTCLLAGLAGLAMVGFRRRQK